MNMLILSERKPGKMPNGSQKKTKSTSAKMTAKMPRGINTPAQTVTDPRRRR